MKTKESTTLTLTDWPTRYVYTRFFDDTLFPGIPHRTKSAKTSLDGMLLPFQVAFRRPILKTSGTPPIFNETMRLEPTFDWMSLHWGMETRYPWDGRLPHVCRKSVCPFILAVFADACFCAEAASWEVGRICMLWMCRARLPKNMVAAMRPAVT